MTKFVNGQVTEKYLWLDKTTLSATYDASGTLKQRYEYTLGCTPTSFTQNGSRFYIATDHLGSPHPISDENGNIIKTVNCDSFGADDFMKVTMTPPHCGAQQIATHSL